jgi:hypothetical protein
MTITQFSFVRDILISSFCELVNVGITSNNANGTGMDIGCQVINEIIFIPTFAAVIWSSYPRVQRAHRALYRRPIIQPVIGRVWHCLTI